MAALLLVASLALSATAGANERQQALYRRRRGARLAMVVIGNAIIARSSVGFERMLGAIDRDEAIQILRFGALSPLSAALAISVIFSIHLAVF
jgi:hypothetical protein